MKIKIKRKLEYKEALKPLLNQDQPIRPVRRDRDIFITRWHIQTSPAFVNYQIYTKFIQLDLSSFG